MTIGLQEYLVVSLLLFCLGLLGGYRAGATC